MAKHFSKMDDGHYIIETDEEYKNRTGGKIGCGGLIVIVILVIGALISDDDDKEKAESSTPVKTETITTQAESKHIEEKTYQAFEEEPVKAEIVETVPAAEKSIEEPLANHEEFTAEETVSEIIEVKTDEETQSKSGIAPTKEAEKKINELFNQVRKACQKKDAQTAQGLIDEMNLVYASLGTSSKKIETKISSAKKMVDKLNQ